MNLRYTTTGRFYQLMSSHDLQAKAGLHFAVVTSFALVPSNLFLRELPYRRCWTVFVSAKATRAC